MAACNTTGFHTCGSQLSLTLLYTDQKNDEYPFFESLGESLKQYKYHHVARVLYMLLTLHPWTHLYKTQQLGLLLRMADMLKSSSLFFVTVPR